MIRCVRGRLQYLVRADLPKAIQRNYDVRSIGAATRSIVEVYVAKQPDRHPMADARVVSLLRRYQKTDPDVDLRQSASSAHGQDWYNLHLVIVNDLHCVAFDTVIVELFAGSQAIAEMRPAVSASCSSFWWLQRVVLPGLGGG